MTVIPSGHVLIGTDKGGLVHGSERPRYEASIPEFMMMYSFLTVKQFNQIVDEEGGENSPIEKLNWEDVERLLKVISAELPTGFEVRLPSEAEWMRGKQHLGFELPLACEEMLWDHPSNNNRGAPIDGRPRLDERVGSLMKRYRASIKSHPTKKGLTFRSQTPIFSPQADTFIRLVIRKTASSEAIRVPEEADLKAIFKQEVLIAIMIGIIPSFLIPIFRGFSDYVLDGWANLVFGGLCISFASAAIWRPRRPTWYLDDDGKSLIARKTSLQSSESSEDIVDQ
jgi:hypothetical protein